MVRAAEAAAMPPRRRTRLPSLSMRGMARREPRQLEAPMRMVPHWAADSLSPAALKMSAKPSASLYGQPVKLGLSKVEEA